MKLVTLSLCALYALAAPAWGRLPAAASRVTSASSVRVRSTPATTGSVVATLGVGTVLEELGRSDAPTRIGDVEDYWYKVRAPGGATGWVFGGLTVAADPARIDDAYLRITRARLDAQNLSLTDWIDLYGFLGRAATGAHSRDARAELEISRLRALGRSMYSVEDDKRDQEPFRSFFAGVKSQLDYSDPAGVWLVRSELFWKVYEACRDTSYAEQAAWYAAENELPGECEGDEECHLSAFLMTTGRYIKLYPRGQYVPDALKDLDELLNSLVQYGAISSGEFEVDAATNAQWKTAARKALASTRETVLLTDSPLKATIVDKLDALDKKFQ